MRTLPPPLANEMHLYRTFSASQKPAIATRLGSLSTTVFTAYSSYAAAADVTALSPVSLPTKDDGDHLELNYTALRSGSCKATGQSIMARSPICCLCGHHQTSQLDHHLPKRKFPEFAAFTGNLVPACGRCNQRKSETYRRKPPGTGPAFLHAYRHALPVSEQFLSVTLNVGLTVQASYEVIQSASMSAPLFATLSEHFRRLKLAILYGDLADDVLLGKRLAFHDYYSDGGPSTLARYLSREARSANSGFGPNHWKTVLLVALANDSGFCAGGFRALGTPPVLPI